MDLILVGDKAALRSPTLAHGALFIQGPTPVNAAVESLGQSPDLLLLLRIVIEVDANRENACQEQRRVESGQLAPPGAPPGLHVKEVIVEPFVTRGIRFRPLRALPKVPQGRENSLRGLRTRDTAMFDHAWVSR